MKNSGIAKNKARFNIHIFIASLSAVLVELFIFVNINTIEKLLEKYGNIAIITEYRIFAIFLFVFIGIFVFVLSFVLMEKDTASKIDKIKDGVSKMAMGDTDKQIEIDSEDEYGEIAYNLNILQRNITRMIEQEKEGEKQKTDLITNIAHDLRTPLTSIVGYLELLDAKPDITNEERQKYINVAYNKSKHLESLIEDLFNFTKLSYGKLTMKLAPLDIVELIEMLLEEAHPNFEKAGLIYECMTKVDSKIIQGDAKLLARLFDNLIGNAIKYGAKGKKVIIRIDEEPGGVRVDVINYGETIPKESLDHLFDKFYRVDSSRTSSVGGTGLGLSIAKNIANLHGGDIKVSSGEQGTIFSVRLKDKVS